MYSLRALHHRPARHAQPIGSGSEVRQVGAGEKRPIPANGMCLETPEPCMLTWPISGQFIFNYKSFRSREYVAVYGIDIGKQSEIVYRWIADKSCVHTVCRVYLPLCDHYLPCLFAVVWSLSVVFICRCIITICRNMLSLLFSLLPCTYLFPIANAQQHWSCKDYPRAVWFLNIFFCLRTLH